MAEILQRSTVATRLVAFEVSYETRQKSSGTYFRMSTFLMRFLMRWAAVTYTSAHVEPPLENNSCVGEVRSLFRKLEDEIWRHMEDSRSSVRA